jgi:hypothetical protein
LLSIRESERGVLLLEEVEVGEATTSVANDVGGEGECVWRRVREGIDILFRTGESGSEEV